MRCDTARAALLDFANGESGPFLAWAIRRHLAACAGCAEELASLQQFQAALRRADLVPSEAAPQVAPLPLARRLAPRRAFAAAMAALLVGGLFLLPTLYQSRRAAQNPGAAIAAALGRVNTWHFSGWKLIDGRQVPWEVWGRRAPWLYCERVGDSITWSDGKQRLRVFPPNPVLNRPHGLIIKTSGDQTYLDLGFLEDPAYQTLVNSQQSRSDFGDGATKLYQQTLTVARFRRQDPAGVSSGVNANKLYTISKRDWLPTGYQLHYDSAKFARDTEYLGVRYDVDLPDAILSPPSADGYSIVDFTLSAKQADGFRVDVAPEGMDKEGNVIITARGWLGKDRLTPGSTFSLDVQPYNGSFFGERRGRTVKYLYATHSSLPPGSDIAMPFAPLEPSQVAGSLPDTFLLTMTASPQILVRSSDQLDVNGGTHPITRTESLINKRFRWRLPLPKPLPNLMAAMPGRAGRLFPSERDLYDQRRIYYNLSDDFQSTFYKKVLPKAVQRKFLDPDGFLNYYRVNGTLPTRQLAALQSKHATEYKRLEQGFRRRAVYWQKRKIAALAQMRDAFPGERNLRRLDDTLLLAKLYQESGDTVGMKRTLRQLIVESENKPSVGVLHRQAQYMLRTGQYPTDADYKGPS